MPPPFSARHGGRSTALTAGARYVAVRLHSRRRGAPNPTKSRQTHAAVGQATYERYAHWSASYDHGMCIVDLDCPRATAYSKGRHTALPARPFYELEDPMKTTKLSKIAFAAYIVLGCSGTSTNVDPNDNPGPDGNSSSAGDGDGDGDGQTLAGAVDDEFLSTYRPEAARAALTHVDTCDALLTGIQNDFLVRVAESAKQLKTSIEAQGNNGAAGAVSYGGGPSWGFPGMGAAGFPTSSGGAGGSFAGPSSGGSNSAGSGSVMVDDQAPMPGSPNNSGLIGEDDSQFSGTNNQELEVDEADIVKADGDRLFMIHGNNLAVLHAWPAAESTLQGSIVLEGNPRDMFLRGDRAVVFSDLWDPWSAGLITDGSNFYSSATKVTVLNVSGDVPTVEREVYLEGAYISSRRHGDVVRTVVQNGARAPQVPQPYIEYYDLFGNPYPAEVLLEQVDEWFARIVAAVRQSDISDWLSREWTRTDGAVEELPPRCEDYFLPDPGVTRPGVTNVVSFDLSQEQLELDGASIFGMAERVYANTEALILASYDVRFDSHGIESEQSLLHRFVLDGASTSYQASGFVPGHLHNQFSLDEQNQIVRVSTTERTWEGYDPANPWAWVPPVPVNRVLALEVANETDLAIIGQTQEFASNEEIYATRFIGNRGYVVTFRQTDPFFVIDLTDPTDPHLVGELKIPGFSEYLHPLDANHLLALGRDSQEVPGGFVDLGQALQIFDVTDPTAPELTHKYVFEGDGTSQANVDHHAITFHAEQNLIAFPFSTYWPTPRNSLEVFQVDAELGFERLGGVERQVPDAECFASLGYDESFVSCFTPEEQAQILNDWRAQCSYYSYFKRGVFRGDAVYGISNLAVHVHDLSDFETPLATVELPPEYGYYAPAEGNYGAGGMGYGAGGAGYAQGGASSAGAGGSYGYYNPYGCAAGAGGAGGYGGAEIGGAGGATLDGADAGAP